MSKSKDTLSTTTKRSSNKIAFLPTTKQLKLYGLVGLFLLIIIGSGLLFVDRTVGEKNNIGNNQNTATATTPTVTPTVPSTPQLLFSDDFMDNTKGWYTGSVSGYTRAVSDNALILSDTNHRVLTESLPTNNIFDDFSLTVSFTLNKGDRNDSVGVYMRGDSNLDHDYRIDIFGNTTYAISKESLTETNSQEKTFLVSPAHTSLLHREGQQNTLTIVMRGPKLVLLINGKVVQSITDTDYIRGQIALFVENGNTSEGVMATFSSMTIYTAPVELPHR